MTYKPPTLSWIALRLLQEYGIYLMKHLAFITFFVLWGQGLYEAASIQNPIYYLQTIEW